MSVEQEATAYVEWIKRLGGPAAAIEVRLLKDDTDVASGAEES
jgi:hypothetical protein